MNGINSTGVNWTKTSCYADDSDNEVCTTTSKSNSCSYFSPTNYQYKGTGSFRVNQDHVPISPHIHGLEIRPVFDGNPLAWFAPDGSKGSGFQTLH